MSASQTLVFVTTCTVRPDQSLQDGFCAIVRVIINATLSHIIDTKG